MVWAIFQSYKWANIEQIILPSGLTGQETKTYNVDEVHEAVEPFFQIRARS